MGEKLNHAEKKWQELLFNSSQSSVYSSLKNTRTRIFVWFMASLQIALPLSTAFSPVIAATTQAISAENWAELPTQAYVMGFGETVATVAKIHGITVDELKKINIYRTFSKPFSRLGAGDEIDVPRKASPFAVDRNQTAVSIENKLARHAVTSASALSNGNAAQSGEHLLRSSATGEISSSAQQWLNKFGSARVQLNVNDGFKLDGSAADMLIPLYEDNKSIIFTQLGARNKDSRNTVNMGAGVRTFHNNWMYGANTFFDNDLTGKNRRIGVGAEAWTDYLKLSANNYFSITDWHQSRDFTDYNERPANGYDLRAEGYLPSNPQLGGKVMYEKYRGDEVALFGKDNRQKNPHAITVGMNYTPIPLVTIGAEHRAGKNGQNDSIINFQLNYRLGETWQNHINPSAVAVSRALAGSRYDLVERNNNIVLDYQKQELIRLTLPNQVIGETGTIATVNAQVTTKYGLERIEWDKTALIAAGGTVTQVSPQSVAVKLPPYQLTQSSNVHSLSAVAYDRQGNASSREIMQVIVTPSAGVIADADFTVATGALANGTDSNALSATVKDAQGNVVEGVDVTFTVTGGAATPATQTVQTSAAGVASASLVSLVAAGNQVTATVGTHTTGVKTSSFVADGSTGVIADADFTVATGALANGTDSNALSATVKDAQGNVVEGVDVTFTVTGGAATPATQTVQTSAAGVASASLVSLVAAGNQVTATVGTHTTGVKTSSFVPAPVDLVISGGNQRKNVGDSIILTLTATYKGTSTIAPSVKITFAPTAIVDRQNTSRSDSGYIYIDGTAYSAFSDITDINGQLVVTVTDPNGIGVKTTLQAQAESNDTASTDVTFNVITSPDTPQANMYGYMSDTILSPEGNTFRRSPLASESTDDTSISTRRNEVWRGFTRASATTYCLSIGGVVATTIELQNFANPNIIIINGWPADVRAYWSTASAVNLQSAATTGGSSGDFIACRMP